jgi:protein gp37
MVQAPQHVYLLLTKRTARLPPVLRDLRIEFGVDLGTMTNVWFGATVESGKRTSRARELLAAHVSRRWLSIEPQVEAVDPDEFLHRCPDDAECYGCGGTLEGCKTKSPAAIDWIVQGCESGARRRPFDAAWARVARDSCSRWGIPYYLKQAPGCGNDDCHCWEPGGECSRPENHPCEDRLERATVVSMPTLDGRQHAGTPKEWREFVPTDRTPLDAWREVKSQRRQRSRARGGAG